MKKLITLFFFYAICITNIAAQSFGAGNLVVLRLGDGTTALATNTAAPVFLDEYTPAGVLVRSIALQATTGTRLTLPGLNSTAGEGILTLSSNGRNLGLVGYNIAAGSATNVSRNTIAGLVKADGVVTYSNGNAFFNGNNGTQLNSFLSEDGIGGYVAAQSGSARIIRYNTELAPAVTTGRVDLVNNTTNTPRRFRQLQVFNNQLYVTCGSQDPDASQIFTVGTGIPTTASQSTTPIAFSGFGAILPAGVQNANQFTMLDMDATVVGPDVMYVSSNGSRNVEKYSLVGGNWVFNDSLVLAGGERFYGLTATKSGSNVLIYATKDVDNISNATATKLVLVTDNTGYNSAANTFRNLTPTVLATAAANTQFRGIAFSPTTPTYYLKAGTTDIGSASSFTSNANGVGGTSPIDLNEEANYIVTNNATATITANTVFGPNASLTIGDGTTATVLNIPSGLTLSAGGVAKVTTIASASSVIVTSGSSYFGRISVNAGATLTVDGTFDNNIAANSGTIAGTLNINGNYNLSTNGALSFVTTGTPTINFANTSTINVTGVTSTTNVFAGLFLANANVGNVVWNSTGQTANGTITSSGSGVLTVKGNFTISSTGASSNHIYLTNGTTNRTMNILGNLNINGGEFRVCGSNTPTSNTANGNIAVTGNVNIAGGILNISSSAGTGTGILSLAGNFTHSSGTLTNTSTGTGTRGLLDFNGTTAQTINTIGVTITNDTSFNVRVNNATGVTLNSTVLTIDSLIIQNGNFTINESDTLSLIGITTTGGFNNTKSIITKISSTSSNMSFVRVRKMASTIETLIPLTSFASNYYSPISLTPSDASDFSVNTFVGLTKNGMPNGTVVDPSDLIKSVNQIWTVNRNIGTLSTTISNSWNQALEGTTFATLADNNIGLAKYNSTWDAAAQTAGNNTSNFVTRSLTSFGPLAVTQLNNVLPLQFKNVNVQSNTTTATINWQMIDEKGVLQYTPQVSQDGVNFNAFAQTILAKNTGLISSYSLTDILPNLGQFYFRIKAVKQDGGTLFSSIVSLKTKSLKNELTLYPLPVAKGAAFQVALNNIENGNYTITLTSISGKRVLAKLIAHNGNNSVHLLALPSTVSCGNYIVNVYSNEKIVATKILTVN